MLDDGLDGVVFRFWNVHDHYPDLSPVQSSGQSSRFTLFLSYSLGQLFFPKAGQIYLTGVGADFIEKHNVLPQMKGASPPSVDRWSFTSVPTVVPSTVRLGDRPVVVVLPAVAGLWVVVLAGSGCGSVPVVVARIASVDHPR